MSDTVIQTTQELPDGLLVQPTGEIDLSRSPQLRVELLEITQKSPARLVVDLADVPYMDSSGVATLIEALQAQRRRNAKMILCGLQPKVRSIFEIARLDVVFTIVADRDAAETA